MCTFEGQRSENQPVKRSLAEKQTQLPELRETLAAIVGGGENPRIDGGEFFPGGCARERSAERGG